MKGILRISIDDHNQLKAWLHGKRELPVDAAVYLHELLAPEMPFEELFLYEPVPHCTDYCFVCKYKNLKEYMRIKNLLPAVLAHIIGITESKLLHLLESGKLSYESALKIYHAHFSNEQFEDVFAV